jgi:hemolysin D
MGLFSRLSHTATCRQDMAFLPAVMEIETTPPSPLGRAVLWAALAEIDIHATAAGRIVPSGRVKPM